MWAQLQNRSKPERGKPDKLDTLLLNAIAHKDYSSGNPIQIKVYEDKIIFWNAGQLPESLTIDSLLTRHPCIPYHPDVATTFFRADLIEAWGRGTLKIINECREAATPIPIFSNDSSGFRIEFQKRVAKMSGKILALIQEDEYIPIPELSQKIGVTERTIERNLQKLQQDKLLKRVGGAKGGHWEVIEK